nr:MAG: replication associated protein [Arizlama virus]
MGSQQRAWVFTKNADDATEESAFWLTAGKDDSPLRAAGWLEFDHFQYLVYQCETAPTTGQVHLQGYIQFSKPKRLAALKKLDARCHWEVRRGTHDEARAYSRKDETRSSGPWEHGEPTTQGKRTDIVELYSMVKSGATNLDMLEATNGVAARFEKAINFQRYTYSVALSDRQSSGVSCWVLYGPTDTGKTYQAINTMLCDAPYYISECPSAKGTKMWFNGYQGEKNLLIDDFDGSQCEYRFLLRLLDKYRQQVEFKGGFVWACWTQVVITTNVHPSGWYTFPPDQSPLARRISEIRLCSERGKYQRVGWDESILDETPSVWGAPFLPPGTPTGGRSPVAPASSPCTPDTPEVVATAPSSPAHRALTPSSPLTRTDTPDLGMFHWDLNLL